MTIDDRTRSGLLEIGPRGEGVLRDLGRNLRIQAHDPVVPADLVRRHRLRAGWIISGAVEIGAEGPPRLAEVASVDGLEPIEAADAPAFEDLTAIDPRVPIRLETGPEPLGTRVMDLLAPVGKGQRGLLVAPPRSGKTVILQQIAEAVATNHPEVELIVLLVDERPEEVTEIRRSVRGRVFASSNDRPFDEHVRLADLAFDRGRRVAEGGGDALILLDSLTRLARAHNARSDSGRSLTGGVDLRALEIPKRLFGSARALDEGGSLTVLATCLVETGSRADELIFQEFKGTGNMELVLSRPLAERRVWPAIDILASGTRKEERLLPAETVRRLALLRRTLANMKPDEAMQSLLRQLAKDPSNADFLDRIGRAGDAR